MKHFYLLIALLAVFTLPAYAQDDKAAPSDVEIVKIKDNLHMLISPQGGNVIASTGEDGTFIIDDQLEGRSEIIEQALKTISDKDIKFILNTHYHFDHTGGNETYGEKGAIIVSQDNVRKRLSSDEFITYFKKSQPALKKAGLPIVTFTNEMTLHYNGDDVQIMYLPNAHTDGDSAAYFKNANVIVTGDIVFNNMYPFIDAEHGGSFVGMIAAQNKLLQLANDDTIILPGHGKAMTKADLQAYTIALGTIGERVKTHIKEGKTLEEVLAANPSAEFDKTMGGGIISTQSFISFLYDQLKK